MANPFTSFLSQISVKGICLAENSKKLVTIWSDDTVGDALKTLRKNQITSAPIMDQYSKKCYAMVDYVDVATFISRKMQGLNQNLQISLTGKELSVQSLKPVADLSGHNPYVPVKTNHKVNYVTDLFSKGLKRVVIVSEEDVFKQEGIITCFSIINFLKNHSQNGQLADMGLMTIKELDLIRKDVFPITEKETVLEAIERITETGTNALPLVNSEGSLIGNFSAADVVWLFSEQAPPFFATAIEYLQTFNPESMRPIFCRCETSLSGVIHLISNEHVHQVWVVDGMKLMGVVTVHDIIKKIATFNMKPSQTNSRG